ncbi:TIR domain-containing protein [Streptomyces californicus]|uniref:TIR domain-containing protein n=1 Tax=Streptomyces TaxID=1883 RepID=UPI0019007065|nr:MULTISPECIES: TIR domain-containing protein [unclassified Streptomyces]MBK0374733.1 toll/interleukin-1 receptor domain-containing protein [Streptomyces sp. RB110-1]MBK0388897.1 toll/interleukin-1 receptor domain-containing protein [Streptomyces sp. RB110-2]
MKVFLSWSGERSRRVAEALRHWLPDVIQEIDPWVSSQDIAKGGRGIDEITHELSATDFGIICVTPENEASKWINFEAGSLGKQFKIAHVAPFLLDMKIADLTGPLSKFQATVGDNQGDVRKLVSDMNKASSGRVVAEDRLERAFARSWPELERALQEARRAPLPGGVRHSIERSEAEMLEEILLLVRKQEFRGTNLEGKVSQAEETLSRSRRISEDEFILASFAKIGWQVTNSSWENNRVNVTAQHPQDGSAFLSRDFIERMAKSLGRPVTVMNESGNALIRSGARFS